MNEKDLPNEDSGSEFRTDKFIQHKTNWISRRRAIQILATGAGATATMALPAFHRNVAIAADGAKSQAVQRIEPNKFELQGYDIQITYSTTSFKGVPQFTFSGRGRELTFSGSDIKSEETGFGRSVTVLLENGAADAPVESLTVLLPFVQLSSSVNELPIQTVAIFSRTALFVIPTNPAQLQTYDTVNLSGTAKLVQF